MKQSHFVNMSCFNKICYTVPPTHLQLMCHPSMCANEWHPTPNTVCLLSLPHRKAQVVSLGYTQNKAQMDHPQGIF